MLSPGTMKHVTIPLPAPLARLTRFLLHRRNRLRALASLPLREILRLTAPESEPVQGHRDLLD